MTEKDAEFQKRLLATFKVEAEEHLKGISSGLLRLEKETSSEERLQIVESVFREAHSLKGAARAVNLTGIETLCQAMEGLFARMKRDEIAFSSVLFDLLQQAADFLGILLSSDDAGGAPQEKALLIKQLEAYGLTGAEAVAAAAVSKFVASHNQDTNANSVRVSTSKLVTVMLQTEEMLAAKLSAAQRASQLRNTCTAFKTWEKEWARFHPVILKLQKQAGFATAGNVAPARVLPDRILEFLEWNNSFIGGLKEKYRVEAKAAEHDSRGLGSMVNNLMEEMKKVLMFPFTSLFEILPKIARDLSRDSGKEVELLIEGGEIEIDRRILEEMKDPFIHLLRNCIDHGIEKPEEREVKKKPRRGTIRISVATMDSKVGIIVSDDGAGIATGTLRSAIKKLGLVSSEKVEELDAQELLNSVFQSGVSTSPIITEISGRGLGLAIVREKVEKFGGTVSLTTVTGAGTTFRIILPLTVATFRGILLRVKDSLFIVPASHVERAVRVKRENIATVENRETVQLNGRPVSLARLSAVLELAGGPSQDQSAQLQAIVLRAADISIAFLVDEVIGEQEVLLKGLGKQLSRVRNVAGATVLGSGRVVPVLNVPDLIKSAVRSPAATVVGQEEGQRSVQLKRALVVEDSITSRSLLKNILEAAGYAVATAVDGLDAFTQLKSGEFDIVVSDVDMPRMNGFGLTEKIRADKQLAELPVVLVTALQSREDRERGIDAGANAYIVKSSFDQGNLLEIMGRLL